ncbi:MAG: hypothetical protein AABW46_00025 [Nanoarchaeota archaeon]
MNERKTLFVAAVVLLIAMFASNFQSSFSGFATSGGTTIDINPNPVVINTGGYGDVGIMHVTVTPGYSGVRNEWISIERNGERMSSTIREVCRDEHSAICYDKSTIQYVVGTNPDTWPSDAVYTVKVEENVVERTVSGSRKQVYATEDFRIIYQ